MICCFSFFFRILLVVSPVEAVAQCSRKNTTPSATPLVGSPARTCRRPRSNRARTQTTFCIPSRQRKSIFTIWGSAFSQTLRRPAEIFRYFRESRGKIVTFSVVEGFIYDQPRLSCARKTFVVFVGIIQECVTLSRAKHVSRPSSG